MPLIIRGKPVERIVVHGSEQTVWESPTGDGDTGAKLRVSNPLEQLPMTDNVHVDFGSSRTVKDSVSMTDTAQLFMSGKNSSMNGITIKGHVTLQVEDQHEIGRAHV